MCVHAGEKAKDGGKCTVQAIAARSGTFLAAKKIGAGAEKAPSMFPIHWLQEPSVRPAVRNQLGQQVWPIQLRASVRRTCLSEECLFSPLPQTKCSLLVRSFWQEKILHLSSAPRNWEEVLSPSLRLVLQGAEGWIVVADRIAVVCH